MFVSETVLLKEIEIDIESRIIGYWSRVLKAKTLNNDLMFIKLMLTFGRELSFWVRLVYCRDIFTSVDSHIYGDMKSFILTKYCKKKKKIRTWLADQYQHTWIFNVTKL